jgi:hypothetical protein
MNVGISRKEAEMKCVCNECLEAIQSGVGFREPIRSLGFNERQMNLMLNIKTGDDSALWDTWDERREMVVESACRGWAAGVRSPTE